MRRITVIRDDVDEISLGVRDSISRKPDWLILSGGLVLLMTTKLCKVLPAV